MNAETSCAVTSLPTSPVLQIRLSRVRYLINGVNLIQLSSSALWQS